MDLFTLSFIHSSTHFTLSLFRSFIHSFTHSLAYLLINSLIISSTHSLIHLITHLLFIYSVSQLFTCSHPHLLTPIHLFTYWLIDWLIHLLNHYFIFSFIHSSTHFIQSFIHSSQTDGHFVSWKIPAMFETSLQENVWNYWPILFAQRKNIWLAEDFIQSSSCLCEIKWNIKDRVSQCFLSYM